MAAEARGRWHDAAVKVGGALDGVMEMLPEVRGWISKHAGDRNHGGVAEDLEEQLGWLLRGGFAWRAGFSRLLEYPRILRGVRSRLGRIASLPLVKDLEKMERFRRLWVPWHRAWVGDPEDAGLWGHGWVLEEWRIALFAPDVASVGKVSEKRIEEAWRAMGGGV
jgi:ATP-dependent helicase HrpA